MKQILQDVRSGITAVKEIPDPLALPGQVLVAEISSAISAGTERYVVDLARTIADNAPLSIAAAKIAVTECMKSASERDLPAVEAAVLACFDSQDYREGRTAFLEKRTPRFTGH